MKRWIRICVFLIILAILEGGLLARGISHQLLNYELEPPLRQSEAYEKQQKIDDLVRNLTIYVEWMPRAVQDSQQAYGRKLARKWRLRH